MTTTCPRCGGALPDGRFQTCPRCLLLEDPEPVVLGERFELGAEIGRGATATVFRARDRQTDGTAAVKLFDEELARDPDVLARFEREVRAASMLEHENVVRVLAHGREGDLAWLATELVEGGSLAERLPLTVPDAVAVGCEICAALACAHAAGLVHRDVKPANLLVGTDGRVKVADFGIARLVGGGTGWAVTGAGRTSGTPHYMAPEALSGAEPDPRMDVYSVGVVLYEALTGRLPVGDFDPIPGPLDAVVRRALAPDPARRYATVEDLAAALERAGGTLAEGALPDEERSWQAATAAVCAVATATAFWAALRSLTPRVIAREDVEPLTLLAPEPLADGRLVARARFETWPVLGALVAFAVAAATWAALRRHWRAAGLDRRAPDRRLRESGWVLAAGLASTALYAARFAIEAGSPAAITAYVPLLGGLVLLGGLFLWWLAVLEARRVARPLAREPRLWVGTALIVLPPTIELVRFLASWTPA